MEFRILSHKTRNHIIVLLAFCGLGLVALAATWLIWPFAVDADTEELQVVPESPTQLTGINVAEGVRLSWNLVGDEGVTGYLILRRRPEHGEKTLIVFVADTGSADKTWTDGSVNDRDRYVYRVKAINDAGVSGVSNFVNIRYNAPLPVNAPDSPKNLAGEVVKAGIKLTWEEHGDESITGYQVVRRRPEKGELTLMVYEEGIRKDATDWTDTSVVDGVRYVYRLQAVNTDGAGEVSNFVNIRYTPVPEPTSAPAPTPDDPDATPQPYTIWDSVQPAVLAQYSLGRASYAVNWLPLDNDDTTVDLTWRVHVEDDDGEAFTECQGEGMAVNHKLMIVDEDPEVVEVAYGATNGDCYAGDYVIVAEFSDGELTRVVKTAFRVPGGDTAEVEEDEVDPDEFNGGQQ